MGEAAIALTFDIPRSSQWDFAEPNMQHTRPLRFACLQREEIAASRGPFLDHHPISKHHACQAYTGHIRGGRGSTEVKFAQHQNSAPKSFVMFCTLCKTARVSMCTGCTTSHKRLVAP